MPNRYICDVLEEMRKVNETRNYSYLLGLIEEIQTMANKMEAALRDKKDLEYWKDKVQKEKEEYTRLLGKTNDLRQKCNEKQKRRAGHL